VSIRNRSRDVRVRSDGRVGEEPLLICGLPTCSAILELSIQFNTIENVHPRTKRQKEVLDYVTRFIDRNGHKPSYQQIARHLGVSSRAGIQRHIAALEGQGLIERRRDNGSFGIELTLRRVSSDSSCNIEMAETTASEPKWSMICVPKFMLGSLPAGDVFAFKVLDDALVDRGLNEGDVALLERRSYARRGDIVLANTVGRLFLCRYYPNGTTTELRFANEDDESITMPSDELVLLGIVRGMLRPIPSIE
jgi:repressor LexA